MKSIAMLTVALALAGCGDGTGPDGGSITYPVTYDLTALRPPYYPGSEYITQDACGRILRSSIDSATMQFTSASEWTIRMRAHKETPNSNFNCAPIVSVSVNSNQSGSYVISGTALPRTIKLSLSADTVLATGTLSGSAGFPATITLSMPRRIGFGSAPVFEYLETSTWTKK